MNSQTKVGNYIINFKEQLGTGNFATVFKAYHVSEKQPFAAKAMDKISSKIDFIFVQMDEIKRNAFKEEIHTLKLKSQFLVKFVEVVEDTQNFYIIQQLCDKNLRQLMKESGKMSQNKAIQIILQIAKGLNYLIKNNIAHRDIKPENILIKNELVKLADFGVSKKTLHNKCYFEDPAGSLNYMSLQALKGQRYTSKCDIWSIGLIFYELLHGEAPWFKSGYSKEMLINKIQNENIKVKAGLTDISKSFLKRCLQIRQQNRCDWKQFFAHPIFEKTFDQYNKNVAEMDAKLRDSLIKFNQKLKKKKINVMQFFQSVYPNISHLNFDEFHRILKWADPEIQINQSLYVFQQTDRKHRAKVSLRDLQYVLFKPQHHQSNGLQSNKGHVLGIKNHLSVDQKLQQHLSKGQSVQDRFMKQTQNISPLKRELGGKKISIIQYESDDI